MVNSIAAREKVSGRAIRFPIF